jgi:DNA-binding transcriptional MerR regulator
MVMAGIDPETKQYTPADVAIRQQIKDIEADKSLPADERKQALDELNESLKAAQPIRNPANVELVKKYYDKVEAVLE